MLRSKINLWKTWIQYWLTHAWHRCPPTHRILCGLVLAGAALATGLWCCIQLISPTTPDEEMTRTTPIVLIADRALLEGSPALPLFFKFQQMPHPPCDHPVLFSESDALQSFALQTGLKKGDILCWEHLIHRAPPESRQKHHPKPTPKATANMPKIFTDTP